MVCSLLLAFSSMGCLHFTRFT